MTALPSPTLRARDLTARLYGAVSAVVAAATVAYSVLVNLVLGGGRYAHRDDAMASGLYAAVLFLVLIASHSAPLYPVIARAIAACAEGLAPMLSDRRALYAAPRRAASFVGLLCLAVLAAGHVPLDGRVEQGRMIAADVGAACALLAALVLYAAVRLALRPLVEALRSDPEADADLDPRTRPLSDRLAFRAGIALGAPTVAAALVVALIAAARVTATTNDEDEAATSVFNLALSVERQQGEGPRAQDAAADALRARGVGVEPSGVDAVIERRAPLPPRPWFWSIPIAILVGAAVSQFGRRIGRDASTDIETAARRLALVGAADIRRVTMRMVRPKSIPEVRDMALALDTLAAALVRMAEDQKRALSARADAARLRSFVLASVSHDLRGPLNSVLGFADLLLSGVDGPLEPGQRESLEALVRGGRDLLRLVDDLLDHARLDASKLNIDRSRVPVDRIVESARAAAIERSKGLGEGDRIVIEGEAGLSAVADEGHIVRAVGALAAYALMRPGSDGRVVLRTRREGGDQIVIAVRGGGATPSREALMGLFDPFDFAPAGARAPAGLNLAVWVARGVIELHGGRVSAAARDEGGVTLTVTLAAAPPVAPGGYRA